MCCTLQATSPLRRRSQAWRTLHIPCTLYPAAGNIALETAIASMADEGALSCIAPLYGTRTPVNTPPVNTPPQGGGSVEMLPVNVSLSVNVSL